MKYAIISDIHSNLEALNAVLDKAYSEGVDKFLFGGDIVGYYANPIECIEIIQSLDLAATVKGNHDEYIGTDMELEGLNPYARDAVLWTRQQLSQSQKNWLNELDLSHVNREEHFTIVHATLDSPASWGYIIDEYRANNSFSYQTTQFCFCGHTHLPMLFKKESMPGYPSDKVEKVPGWDIFPSNESEMTFSAEFGSTYLVNIGSVGPPRNRDNRASFVIYNSSNRTIKRICVEYDIATTQNEMRKAGLPDQLAKRLYFGF
jgi:diadenosine tetraphosphatase ApaH/serine/threonine PP2A family protein phosphatase